KIAMVRIFDRLRKEVPSAKIIMQVHDEIIVEAKESDAETVKTILVEEMENACQMKVRLTASAAYGKTWYEAKGD
ncbi:MAG: hypothetical protein IJU45_06500, partial [Clostridia bacterium]|nr:hypothetical protein [Clostridia bacterium]